MLHELAAVLTAVAMNASVETGMDCVSVYSDLHRVSVIRCVEDDGSWIDKVPVFHGRNIVAWVAVGLGESS